MTDLYEISREAEPLPDWLTVAVDAALADLQQPTKVDIILSYEPAANGSGMLRVREKGERDASGHTVPHNLRGVELLVSLADWFQEQFFPESRSAWGEARPECLGHSHPAHPEEIGGEAWWECPADGRPISPIGQFGQ